MGRTQLTGDEIRDDSLTGDDVYEETLDAEKIPFSNPDFISTNIKEAIIESKEEGISDFTYVLSENLIIENNKSKVVADTIDCNGYDIEIEDNGILGVY